MRVNRIYLDMDGVLADFDRGVAELLHLEPRDQNRKFDSAKDDRMWQTMKTVDHFYDRLELMPGAKEMFDRIRARFGDRCEILTGIPREERGIVTAAQDKIAWTRRMLSGQVVIHTVCRKHKQDFCHGPEDVLIDDREKTILEWREKGGTGILHTSAEETLKKLEELEA